jgi:hypothetical protein
MLQRTMKRSAGSITTVIARSVSMPLRSYVRLAA